ncbi:MAG TPA: hypothetical protein VE548_04580 [Nitrososphaeraceae archaeon]|jgi:hypothetical protein|nr:hypothetical protein [Nitrososphaeraceae archaeon]
MTIRYRGAKAYQTSSQVSRLNSIPLIFEAEADETHTGNASKIGDLFTVTWFTSQPIRGLVKEVI